MKTFITLVLLFSATMLSAVYENCLEVRYAPFFPTSKEFREATGFFGNCFELEASHQMYGCLEFWGNFDWFNEKGGKRVRKNPKVSYKVKTRIQIANFSFGLNTYYNFAERFTIYAGIGPSFAQVLFKTKTPFKPKKSHTKIAVGGVTKFGLDYLLAKNVYIDVFVDYLYLPVHLTHFNDASGVKIGIGLGIKI